MNGPGAIPVGSTANPHFRRWQRLARAPREVRAAGATLVEGEHLATAVIEAGHAVRAVILRRGHGARAAALLARLWDAAPAAACFELAASLYDAIAPVEHGLGLMLEIPLPPPVAPADDGTDVLYLDGVQDPGNAGALIRLAAAADVGWVLAGTGTAALWAPKVMRAAMGAHFALRVVEGIEPAEAGAAFPLTWLGADLDARDAPWDLDLAGPAVGWVLGAEGGGLSEAGRGLCSVRVRIPLSRGVESLNVAAAAAVCLFERRRQLSRRVVGEPRQDHNRPARPR